MAKSFNLSKIMESHTNKGAQMKQLWNLAFQYNFRQMQVRKTVIPKEMIFSGLKKGLEHDLLRFLWVNVSDYLKLSLVQISMCIAVAVIEDTKYNSMDPVDARFYASCVSDDP